MSDPTNPGDPSTIPTDPEPPMPNDPQDDESNLGQDGTIPNSETGIALGHDPDGSNFNQEEDV